MKKDYLEPVVKVIVLNPETCCFGAASGGDPDGEIEAKEIFFDLDEEL